jgi:cholest-4-en-3-one 26-monooxygenase
MMAFADNPDQWELFKAERPNTAADEITRWASPITAFQRTALADTELGGVRIEKGQRLVLFYRSANFDEDVFDDPLRSISCEAQPALGIRRHRRTLLRRRQSRQDDHRPDVQRDRRSHSRPEAVAAPERLRSSMINGIKHWQVEY